MQTMWGYAPDEQMDASDLLKIKYDGIRPAPGYPSQPDHSEKTTMWNLIQAKDKAGMFINSTTTLSSLRDTRCLQLVLTSVPS